MPILGKKRKVGASPKQVMFGAFTEDRHLCVVQCLKQYEAVTQQFRTKEPNQPQPLFLSYVKLHSPLNKRNTSVFKARSVRGALSTATSEKGVLIEDILRTAD